MLDEAYVDDGDGEEGDGGEEDGDLVHLGGGAEQEGGLAGQGGIPGSASGCDFLRSGVLPGSKLCLTGRSGAAFIGGRGARNGKHSHTLPQAPTPLHTCPCPAPEPSQPFLPPTAPFLPLPPSPVPALAGGAAVSRHTSCACYFGYELHLSRAPLVKGSGGPREATHSKVELEWAFPIFLQRLAGVKKSRFPALLQWQEEGRAWRTGCCTCRLQGT